MDRPVLIIEMPELNDEAAVNFQLFLQTLMNAFENHYHSQIKRYYEELYPEDWEQDLF